MHSMGSAAPFLFAFPGMQEAGTMHSCHILPGPYGRTLFPEPKSCGLRFQSVQSQTPRPDPDTDRPVFPPLCQRFHSSTPEALSRPPPARRLLLPYCGPLYNGHSYPAAAEPLSSPDPSPPLSGRFLPVPLSAFAPPH